jgi:hypothetical protein
METIPEALTTNTVRDWYDRVEMLTFLLNALLPTSRKPLKRPKYTKRLELEIRRIAQLPNPDRTVQAMALYKAWQDSRTVTECIRAGRRICIGRA